MTEEEEGSKECMGKEKGRVRKGLGERMMMGKGGVGVGRVKKMIGKGERRGEREEKDDGR